MAYETIGEREFPGWITFKWERIWKRELEPAEIALPYFKTFIAELMG